MSRGNVGARGTVRGPQRRVARLGPASLGLFLGLGACAHGAGKVSSRATEDTFARELVALRAQVHERDQLVTQLEGRLSLLEAEQRQLRYALTEREAAPVGLRETVRIGDRMNDDERPVREPKREARPVLRLYEDKRPASMGQDLQSVPVVSERLPVAPLPSALDMPKPGGDRDSYLVAIDLLRRRDFVAALAALDAFLARTPGDERVGRALFWRGEALFAQKRYDQALTAFESSLSREPRGEKAADSLLKIGLCHKRLGAPERARDAMIQLKAQFPQSHAARLAQAEEA